MRQLAVAILSTAFLLPSLAASKGSIQTLDVPFLEQKAIVRLEIESQKLGALGKCKTKGKKKSANCAEPEWPGKCFMRELIPNEAFRIECQTQAQTLDEATELTTVELVRQFKFPDTILVEMQTSGAFKKEAPAQLSKRIKTTKENWGQMHSWTSETDGTRTLIYLCRSGSSECFRTKKDGILGLKLSVREIKTESL